ncbi:FMN-dependent dehydrogenase-domain-containing protein [Gaertneriomyces semiglobifer]|nr:FMN-dependent dehydrogenase-domain-containing protein [Gaertneriomyces semiglobifer]
MAPTASSNSQKPRLIPFSEVQSHTSKDDCWCIIYNKVYNLTPFLSDHPGGVKPIVTYAGRDATAAFDPIHPPGTIEKFLTPELCLGEIDTTTLPKDSPALKIKPQGNEVQNVEKPPLTAIFNTFDFESVARSVLRPNAWAYYSSGAEDEQTLQENRAVFLRVYLKPRVLRNVRLVNPSTSLNGSPSALPIYISATALGRLGHPDGEMVLTRGAARKGIIQMIPTLASCSLDEIASAMDSKQTMWFQVYVNKDRERTKTLIQEAIQKCRASAVFVTVDAPQLGRREKDMRTRFVDAPPSVQSQHQSENVEMEGKDEEVERDKGAAQAITGFIDPGLNWDDIKDFASTFGAPIYLKGVQTAEDAILAVKTGYVKGIVVSNHGGRQVDTARSGLECLAEITGALRKEGLLRPDFEIYMDGGIRRGSDIFKALALGARGVGLGRPFLYAMSSYGREGVEHLIDLLREEFCAVMRMMGVTRVDQINGSYVQTGSLETHSDGRVKDGLGAEVYERMKAVAASKL